MPRGRKRIYQISYCIDCRQKLSAWYVKRCYACRGKQSRCKDPIKRFWEGIEKQSETGCWIWKDAKSKAGYGQFRVNDKAIYAHRFSYELHNGSIPNGKHVCHTCDTPECNQPLHLFLGTHKINMEDAATKGHFAKSLTESDIKWIKKNHKPRQGAAIARRFGVSTTAIYLILHGKNWKHI